jgi:two-component system NarL family sensor kinase
MVRRAPRGIARDSPDPGTPSAPTELATLTALAQALSGSADLAASLEAALATVADALGLETGWVWLLDDSGEPRLAAARALPPGLREHPDAMHGDCYCLKTFRAGDLRGAANVNVVWCSRLAMLVDDEQDHQSTDAGGRLQCHASVPLSVGERHLGMLNVASRDWRVLSDAELSLLTTAGALVSLAVERSRLEAAGVRAIAAEERNRLAREIHDTLAQGLAALTMQLEVADSLATGRRDSDARLETAVGRALELARSTLDEARRSVLDLREAPLEGRSLEDALASLAADARLGSPRGPTIDVTVDAGTAPEIPAAVEQGLYRIAQQAVANSVRHAAASRVAVRLTWSPDAVGLRVEDDGDGFDPTAVPGDRFGLVGMQERARLLGGTLRVESAPGAGTAIDVRIPIGVRPAQSGGDDT